MEPWFWPVTTPGDIGDSPLDSQWMRRTPSRINKQSGDIQTPGVIHTRHTTIDCGMVLISTLIHWRSALGEILETRTRPGYPRVIHKNNVFENTGRA